MCSAATKALWVALSLIGLSVTYPSSQTASTTFSSHSMRSAPWPLRPAPNSMNTEQLNKWCSLTSGAARAALLEVLATYRAGLDAVRAGTQEKGPPLKVLRYKAIVCSPLQYEVCLLMVIRSARFAATVFSSGAGLTEEARAVVRIWTRAGGLRPPGDQYPIVRNHL